MGFMKSIEKAAGMKPKYPRRKIQNAKGTLNFMSIGDVANKMPRNARQGGSGVNRYFSRSAKFIRSPFRF